jgi:hypothetical protein
VFWCFSEVGLVGSNLCCDMPYIAVLCQKVYNVLAQIVTVLAQIVNCTSRAIPIEEGRTSFAVSCPLYLLFKLSLRIVKYFYCDGETLITK